MAACRSGMNAEDGLWHATAMATSPLHVQCGTALSREMAPRFQRILVAGGDGFIGRHLCRALMERGIEVIVVDDHSTSCAMPPNMRQTIEQDVAELSLAGLPRVDAVIHLASPAAPHLFCKNPLAVIRPNTVGTSRLLDLAQRDGGRMLFASTSEVYGYVEPGTVQGEEQHAIHPLLTGRSVYGAAKRLGEELVHAARGSNVDAASVRLFNVYGPGMDPTMGSYARVIPNFVRAAFQGRPMPIEGNGEQVRSFTWIDDVVEGLVRLLLFDGILPSAVNLGRDEPIAIRDLASLIERLLGVQVGREPRVRASDDTNWRRPDLQLLAATLHWTPAVSLTDGLARLIAAERAALPQRSPECL